MLIDQRLCDGQAETGAVTTARDQGKEHVIAQLLRHAGTVVVHLDAHHQAVARLTEVLFDPAGPEPQQEFVEFMTAANLVYEPGRVHLHDGTWEDILAEVEAGSPAPGDPLPRVEAAPGRVFVVVPEAHEWSEGAAPPPDAVILRIPGSLGHQGLRNSGEPLTLYDAWTMTPMASFGAHGWPSVGPEGRAMVRLDLHASCDARGAWGVSDRAPTPGSLP